MSPERFSLSCQRNTDCRRLCDIVRNISEIQKNELYLIGGAEPER